MHCAHSAIVDPSTLEGNPRNPNTHPERQIKLLAKVIQGNGWRLPITISNRSGLIVRGHGRLAAALLLDVDAVPVDYQDYDSEAAEMADMLADNRLPELAEINIDSLAMDLDWLREENFDLELAGFDEDGPTEPNFQPTDPDEQPRLDQKDPAICPKCGHEFEA